MGKCPLRRNCTGVDRELLIEHGVSAERLENHYGSESMRFKHCLCDGEGTPPNQWRECAKFDPIKAFNPSGSSSSSENGGCSPCYVATCVYGSYDCPEVWTLRRYRDNSLNQSWFGKQFIQVYYTIGPKIVKLFGNKRWFNQIGKSVLDKFVTKLWNNGVDNSPYSDN